MKRANLVLRAEEWWWSSVWRRCHGTGEERSLLAAWPIDVPVNWLERVNQSDDEPELESVRRRVQRGRPFRQSEWQKAIAKRLGVESAYRRTGRPRKAAGNPNVAPGSDRSDVDGGAQFSDINIGRVPLSPPILDLSRFLLCPSFSSPRFTRAGTMPDRALGDPGAMALPRARVRRIEQDGISSPQLSLSARQELSDVSVRIGFNTWVGPAGRRRWEWSPPRGALIIAGLLSPRGARVGPRPRTAERCRPAGCCRAREPMPPMPC